MKREIIVTEDGSTTLYVPELDEHYHSVWGAVQESEHVFIKEGLRRIEKQNVSILEVGFGTGLNALLTIKNTSEKSIYYKTFELYPLLADEVKTLNFNLVCSKTEFELFKKMHSCPWKEDINLQNNFIFHKVDESITSLNDVGLFDLVYFDAFAPNKQTGLWGLDTFEKIYSAMKHGGVLTTYCAKGEVRRTMQKAGFTVERVPGPPHKREMLVARKWSVL